VVGLYFVGYQSTRFHPPSPGLGASVKTTLAVLSVAVGEAGSALWPFSGIGVAVLLVAGIALGLVVAITRPAERVRALGLTIVLGSFGLLAAAIGHGR